MMYLRICALAVALTAATPAVSFAQEAHHVFPKTIVRVPFVGCASDGQTGPLAAPKSSPKIVQMNELTAEKLAYYKSEMTKGVLAPRGWHCGGFHGSGGTILIVTPGPMNPTQWIDQGRKRFTGPIVELDDFSDRFAVAEVIAKVFPGERAFADQVIKELQSMGDGADLEEYDFGPYKTDKIMDIDKGVVDYQTPANRHGLGTLISALEPDNDPIVGVAFLSKYESIPAVSVLSARFPGGTTDLAPYIVTQLRRDMSVNMGSK